MRKRIIVRGAILLCLAGAFSQCTNNSLTADQASEVSGGRVAAFPNGFHPRLTTANCTWDAATGKATIKASVVFGGDNDIQGFYWQVPSVVKTIYINGGVTVTGGFRMNHPMTIQGGNRSTSVIFGTNTKVWKSGRVNDEWNYTAISPSGLPAGTQLNVKNLTVKNARTYNINSYDSKIVVDNCDIINTRGANDENSNNDGIGGAAGTTIRNCYLAVNDDVIKVYEPNMVVKNTTINLQSKNSVAFQMGWDNSPDANASATLTNVLVKGNSPQTGGGVCGGGSFSGPGYNMGIFAWKGGNQANTRTLTLNGFKVTGIPSNAHFYNPTCGNWSPMALVTLFRSNGTLVLKGSNVFMSAPRGSALNGTTRIQFCGLNTTNVSSSYSCGTDNVTGSGR